MSENNEPITFGNDSLENCFTAELVDGICKSNKVCSIEDMLAIGLEGNPSMLNELSAFTIPLGRPGASTGFILIYRTDNKTLDPKELACIASVAPGFSRAIDCCGEPAGLAE